MQKLKPTIYFRTDGNTQIGLGHITRSMALADMLKEEFYCIFLVQNPSEILQKQIRENFELITLPETEDYLAEAQFIKENIITENDTVVLDGYNFKTEYQKILKNDYHLFPNGERLGVRLICIDDLHAWHFVADAIINHAGGVQPSDYSCESYTKLYLGTDYALLRKPFLEAAKKERQIEKIENVFICFGGSDVHNLSLKATEACLSVPEFKEIHVVLGSAYPFYEEFAKFAQAHHKIKLHQNLNAQEMCDLMQSCELAIAPASSVAYEVLAVGMYLITGWYAENQREFAYFLEKNNALNVGDFGQVILSQTINNRTMLFQITKLTDGFQQIRYKHIFS